MNRMQAAACASAAGAVLLSMAATAATPGVAAGGHHGVALHQSGTLRAWGSDDRGQLGTGRTLLVSAPSPIPIAGIAAIAGGDSHTVVAKTDGTVWALGANGSGQLGDGTTTDRSEPVRAKDLGNVITVAAGGRHTLALRRDGTVWAWGNNAAGQVGDLTAEQRLAPVQVANLAGVVAIAAGEFHSLALKGDGTVWSWGWNCHGQVRPVPPPYPATCGLVTAPQPVPGPQQVEGLAGVTAISSGPGAFQSIALRADGTVVGWGQNVEGQLGAGELGNQRPVTAIEGIAGAIAIASGGYHTAVLRADGTVWATGFNGQGQLGDGTTTLRTRAVQVAGLAGVRAIAEGFRNTYALKADGSVLAWGDNRNGQLGDGTQANRPTAAPVAGLTAVTMLAAGGYHLLAVRSGNLVGLGDNGSGQLAVAALLMHTTPQAVNGFDAATAIAAGLTHTLALRENGTVWGFGRQAGGELGDGTVVSRSSPVQAIGLVEIVAIAAGYQHSVAVKRDGTVWSWGANFSCVVGCFDGPNLRTIPARYPMLDNVATVSAGYFYSLALRRDGTVWSWGNNDSGQLGFGGTFIPLDPQRVAGLADVVAIAAGLRHALAIQRDGSLWAWGANDEGQLGDGTSVDRPSPVRVGAPGTASGIAAGYRHSVALRPDGTVLAWGNLYPREGIVTKPEPFGSLSRVAAVAAGNDFTLALLDDGTVASWGDNLSGRLGDGSFAARPTAVMTLRENGAGALEGNDWFLDLRPGIAKVIPPERTPVFQSVASRIADTVDAEVRARVADRGRPASYYTFALAPATIMKSAELAKQAHLGWKAKSGGKDTQVECVIAQLNASGQLQAVSAANLQAYLSGVLTSQAQAVRVIDGVPSVNIAGATFFVGYGATPDAMLAGGTNRSVLAVPGEVECRPEAPETGWWWNPAEDGRGFSIEKRGNNLFFAAFLYDVSGRSTWHVSNGPISLEGSLYAGELLSASGGQTLGGPYTRFPTLGGAGPITLAFNSARAGTMVWPGGIVPIQRFDIVPNGRSLPAPAGVPESGWWWNEQEPGRGFFMEWQGSSLDIAGYMYDDKGDPVWYLTVGEMAPGSRSFSGSWWSYANGQTLTGPWRPNTRTSTNVAPLAITFSGPDAALMTLPNGRTTSLRRHRF